jgi:hypothetical protein
LEAVRYVELRGKPAVIGLSPNLNGQTGTELTKAENELG